MFKLSYGIPKLDGMPIDRLEYYARTVSELGYEGIECDVSDAAKLDWRKIEQVLDRYDLKLSGLRSGGIEKVTNFRFSHPDAENRKNAVIRMNQLLDMGGYFKCPVLLGRLQGIGSLGPGESVGQAKEWIAECVRACSTHAEQLDTYIAYEPMNHYQIDYNNTTREMIEYVNYINEPLAKKVTLLMDVFHMWYEDSSVTASFIRANEAGLLGHVHISGNRHGLPSEGCMDYPDYIKVLEALHYDKWAALEVHNYGDEWADCAKASMDYLRPLITAAINWN